MAGEVGEKGLGVAYARFEYSPEEESVPAGSHGEDRWRRPLEELLRRACSSAWAISGLGNFSDARGKG
jgi:hypothetical protein